jgi:metacaspase-1
MSRRTKALLVGINDYPPPGSAGQNLQGCLNDIEDMTRALEACGFEGSQIKLLRDQEATKARILAELRALVQGNNPGDSIVFYFSGHGSFRRDDNDDDGEPDHKDEVICPHELIMVIKDDELRAIIETLDPAVNLEVFLDCCHSGTGTRLKPVPGERFMEPPPDAVRAVGKYKSRRMLQPSGQINHTLWAACMASQNAEEHMLNQKMRGVFTHFLSNRLIQTRGEIGRKDLYKLVIEDVSQNRFRQVAQLETVVGGQDKPIFE